MRVVGGKVIVCEELFACLREVAVPHPRSNIQTPQRKPAVNFVRITNVNKQNAPLQAERSTFSYRLSKSMLCNLATIKEKCYSSHKQR